MNSEYIKRVHQYEISCQLNSSKLCINFTVFIYYFDLVNILWKVIDTILQM